MIMEIISGIALIISFGSLFIAVLTLYNARKTKMEDDVYALMNKLYEDTDISEILKKIDGEPGERKEWYKNGDFLFRADESKIDKILYTFSYVCYLMKKRRISKDLFNYISYYINAMADNESTREYLIYVKNMCKQKNISEKESPLYYFQKYAEKRKEKIEEKEQKKKQ